MTETKTAADVLAEMADTYRERNKVYGDNFRNVGPIMKALHPAGIGLESAEDHEMFHLWNLIVVKLSRFAVSKLTHMDSIHDAAVYCAMIESIMKEREKNRDSLLAEIELSEDERVVHIPGTDGNQSDGMQRQS